MNGAPTARKPREAEAARTIALYEASGFLDVQRAQAGLWLLEQMDGGHLSFSHPAMSAGDLEDWVRGIAKDAVAASLAAAGKQIAAAATQTDTKAVA